MLYLFMRFSIKPNLIFSPKDFIFIPSSLDF